MNNEGFFFLVVFVAVMGLGTPPTPHQCALLLMQSLSVKITGEI